MKFNFSKIKSNVQQLPNLLRSDMHASNREVENSDTLKSSKRQLYLQMFIFLLFALLSVWVISQVRVNGPIYKNINEFNDLEQDVASPALYPVEAYAAYNLAFVAAANQEMKKRDRALVQAVHIEERFKARAAYWRGHLSSPPLRKQLELAITAGENFFFAANKTFKPALLKGAGHATTPLMTLTEEFDISKKQSKLFFDAVHHESASVIERKTLFIKVMLLSLLFIGLWLIIFMYFSGTKRAVRNAELTNRLAKETKQNQEAVKLLLYEMGELADGDLTVKAQVRDSITGAIADAINFAIKSLRGLVVEINKATEQVTSATTIAQGTSTKLLEAAKTQTVEIKQATKTVSEMTTSIMSVSNNAETATNVAKQSLATAMQGTQAVQNTIAGMQDMRTQIQETAKRMKRLGESSQEISEIVELISDITEQTNILSLNAAIQAASAGEAGRGFTVVAEEVQRLAERSSEATQQIIGIVKTIQTDTNGAVAAMEKSTAGVVEGTQLADHAGKALAQIETVTNHLAVLIQAISDETKAQAHSATTVRNNMASIQNVTSETTETTQQSAESVKQLNALAKELRYSVAGFKL